MGLDGVELIMALEEEFDIEIEDHDVGEMVYVVDIVDYVYFKVRKRTPEKSTREVVEKKIFQAIGEVCNTFNKSEKHLLGSELKTLFPPQERIKKWEELRQFLQVGEFRWPCLKRPLWLMLAIIALPLLLPISFSEGFIPLYFFTLAPLFFIILLFKITRRFKRYFPRKIKTVEYLVDLYFKGSHNRVYSYDNVRSRVKEIVVEQLGVPKDDVTDNAHLIHDLGVD